MIPNIFYALSAQSLCVFVGFIAEHIVERCRSLGNDIGNLVAVPDDSDTGALWELPSTTVQFFISPKATWSALQRVLPPEAHYASIVEITFILVEHNQRFAEQWMPQSKSILLALSQAVHCRLEVENIHHLIRVSPLGQSRVKVDVVCSPRDTESLWRVTPLTRGNQVELSVNRFAAEHLPALQGCNITSLRSPYNACPGILPRLSSLPHLRSLTLTSTSRAIQQPFNGALPSLETMKLDMPMEHVFQVLKGFYTAALTSFELDSPALNERSDLPQLANLLSQRCARTLTSLCIRIHGLAPLEDASWLTISPFYRLSLLQTFIFEHPLPLKLSADQVKSLLRAWPRAVWISLNPLASIPQQGSETLSHMNVLLALRCYSPPTLRYFGISVDFETSLIDSGFQGNLLGGSDALETLDLGNSRIVDELRVFSAIHMLFPNLDQTKHGRSA